MPGPDARLGAALQAGAGTPAQRAELLAALRDATVVVGVSATATGETIAASGLRAESGAELAIMLLEAPDGSRALPVFSGVGALRAWRMEARPVPMTGSQACAAARDEGAQQVVLDPAGTAVVLEPAEVAALADGWVPVAGTPLASRTGEVALTAPTAAPEPALVAALRSALAGEDLTAARLLAGPDGLVLGVVSRQELAPAALAALAQRVVDRIGPALPAAGLGLTQVPRRGPGHPVLRSRWRR